MKLTKETIYSLVISSVLLVIIIIISIVIAFKQSKTQEYTKAGFDMMQEHLIKLGVELQAERELIDVKLDSLNKVQLTLEVDLAKYNEELNKSVRRIKRYKNEIIQSNYRDSSTISIIDRLNAG